MKRLLLLSGAVLFLNAYPVRGEEPNADGDAVVRAMQDELKRSADQLRLPDAAKPYYLALILNDQTGIVVRAAFGALIGKYLNRGRYLRADVRVGDYGLDNTNMGGYFDFVRGIQRLPLDDDYEVIRHDVWQALDEGYKQAAAAYAIKLAMRQRFADSSDEIGDFSRETPSRIIVRRAAPVADVERAVSLAKDLSALARKFPDIQTSEVQLMGAAGREVVLTSEGTFTDENDALVALVAELRTQAPDGMPLIRYVTFFAGSLDTLPARDVLEREFVQAAQELSELRHADPAADYLGPVLFEATAAAQVVREVLAPHLSGAPAPRTEAGRGTSGLETEFAGKVGQRVLPKGFRVEDDPTIDHLGPLALVGRYAADEEGMPGRKVVLVEDGLLKTFLMSRAPRKGFEQSNGHARGNLFMRPRASVANLVVTAKKGLSAAELRRRLLTEAKAAGQSYGLIVRALDNPMSRGDYGTAFRQGGRNLSSPLVVVKVSADGKEQPLRGATFGSLPLRAFEEILAAGREPAVASTILGAASSVVSPALLFKRVEVKKPSGPQRKLPVLPHPYFAQFCR